MAAIGDIDMQLGELQGIIEAVIMLQEDSDDRERVRLATIALLYTANDKLRSMFGSVGQLHRSIDLTAH
ncbi:hypothetical protein [Mesorhizobium sp. Z1-4]|uniref:hypothetical protein n=1 Tax=Mesorhizobium sp. Z1-4 TaxID=2448478 RepID=UPI000FDA168C|nr:hypothetical protein [Mesorhizobium sp. Z1-4]